MDAESPLEAELAAVQIGLRVDAEWALNIEVVFTDCNEAKKALERSTNHYNCKIGKMASNIWGSFNLSNINTEGISREWNTLADELTSRSRRTPETTLFHRGLELPYWLMRSIKKVGFHFA